MSSSTIQVTDSSDLSGQSTSRLVLQMARRDIATLFRTPWIIISRSLAFIIQLFVFAYLISGLVVKFPGFFPYYAVGSVVSVVASISFIIGYDIFEEAEEGLLDYLLTLPIPRREFIIGRALGGAVRAMIYTIPMFAIVAVLENFSNPLSLVAAVFDFFFFPFWVSGPFFIFAVNVPRAHRIDVVLGLFGFGACTSRTPPLAFAFLLSYVAALAPFSPVTF